jgi:aspartate/methionine/tyrosine aminotransferase
MAAMRIPNFQMERMQSTWENLVDYDLSESGVRPVTLRGLVDLGLELDAALDMPLGYSQSNGTIALRECLAAIYPGAGLDQIEVTNGTSEANYLVALALLEPGDGLAMELPNYMQLWGVPQSLSAPVTTFRLRPDRGWEPDWEEFDRAVTRETRLLYLSNPNNPSGAVLSDAAMRRIVERCERTGTWLLSDEVYQGAELEGGRTKSFWGMSDRVIVSSGLSKAYGIPGVRIGWIVGPPGVVEATWSQHDYITIGPNKLSDMVARVAVTAENRETLYERTRAVLTANLPIIEAWAASFGDLLEFNRPRAGAMTLVRYRADVPSLDLCERIRIEQSTLVVPGSHVGLEGYLRIWYGGRPEYITEGLRRIGVVLSSLRAGSGAGLQS